MKDHIKSLIQEAITHLQQKGELPNDLEPVVQIERTRDPKHGDFACNIAMVLAKAVKQKPQDLAKKIVAKIFKSDQVAEINIAGAGFINFKLADFAVQQVVPEILQAGKNYGRSEIGAGKQIHIEFVSANPTGPLHVGHGRGAAFGACVVDLLKAVGYKVFAEYYVNDAGRQMRILALSTWLRYLELLGEEVTLPANAYRGQYIIHIAQELLEKQGEEFKLSYQQFISKAPRELDTEEQKELYLDALIATAEKMLGNKAFQTIKHFTSENILDDIKDDLSEFGVNYDEWFYESRLQESNLIEEGRKLLAQHGHVYEKDGAIWFRATDFGDEKDRVLIRENGHPTYFAFDVAHHLYKYNQGYDQIVDVFGADHHGYVSRIHAFLRGLGKDAEKLKVLLVQFAILYRGKEKISMSTRAGHFVTLRELRYEVGNDAARYFYIMRKPDQHLDFDLELAKSQSNENPVYYIQYAHARICSVFQQLQGKQWEWDCNQGLANLALLTSDHEIAILKCVADYPQIIEKAAIEYQPHLLAHYLQELANYFHTYYNANKFLVEDSKLRNIRLALISAVKQVIANGLHLLGLSAPTSM